MKGDDLRLVTTIALPERLWWLLDRAVSALERIAPPAEGPGSAPAGLLLVPRGAEVSVSMANEIPLGFDGLQRFRPQNYDGPISGIVESGPATVASQDEAGDLWRITLAEGAVEGDEVVVVYTADQRHGGGTAFTSDRVVYDVVAADAEPLTEAGFEVVARAAPGADPLPDTSTGDTDAGTGEA